MPRNGQGVYSKPAGTTAVPNTTIESAKFNTAIDDLVQDANAARPVTAGGTGSATPEGARTGLSVPGLSDVNAFTKIQKLAKGADVASASALTLGDDGNYFDVTGATAITSIATKGVGAIVRLHFDAALTLTHHSTDLVLPGAANIVTAAGDEAEFVEYAAGDWRCTSYSKANGSPLKIVGTVSQASGVPTGGIVERGSNANGEYVRYADGTQICWFNANLVVTTANTYFGNFGSFPAAFSSTATCQMIGSVSEYNTGATAYFLRTRPTSGSAWSITGTINIIGTITVSMMAIGRWF